MSNIDFWKRYYFKRHLLEEEEARRLELMKRAEDVHEQKELGWDEGALFCLYVCMYVCMYVFVCLPESSWCFV